MDSGGGGRLMPALALVGGAAFSASGRGLGPDVQRSAAAGAAGSVPDAPARRDEPGAAVGPGVDPDPACTIDPAVRLPRSPPVVPPPGASTAGQAVLSLTARYGKDLPVINGGLVWRVFADRPDETGTFKLIREDRGATPNIVLPPGSYVVHVALGLVSAVRPVTLKSETDRESFVLPAGGLRIEGRVGTSKIPQNQISFAIYKGSQFEASERAAAVAERCRRAMSRCCRRGPTTSSPITATPIRWCARTSACRPAS